jgi:hypothetical protein
VGDTWLYDAGENAWTDVTPPAGQPSPGPRCGHGLCHDAARGATILFGGHTTKFSDETDVEAYLYQKSHSDRGTSHNDTWAFDASAGRWTRLAPAASPPPAPDIAGAMVYDAPRRRIVLIHTWKPKGSAARKYNTAQVWALGGSLK